MEHHRLASPTMKQEHIYISIVKELKRRSFFRLFKSLVRQKGFMNRALKKKLWTTNKKKCY